MTKHVPGFAFAMFVGFGMLTGCGGQRDEASQSESSSEATPGESESDDVALTQEEIETLENEIADYADALTKIKSFRDTIRDSVAAGRPTKAHRPLDELDVVLNHLPEVARDSNVPRSDWEAVNTNAQKLRDLFNKVHADIDGGREPDYASAAEDIDTTIQSLEQIKPSEASGG